MIGDFLHIGCGRMQPGETDQLPLWAKGCKETRLDIDPDAKPDVVASMLDMGEIGLFDTVYSSHTLEHLYPHQVSVALEECLRVLKPGGLALTIVPDLEGVLATDDMLYMSIQNEPISGLDMIYGKASFVASNQYMAHHCGFTSKTLKDVLTAAGFEQVTATRMGRSILSTGKKPCTP